MAAPVIDALVGSRWRVLRVVEEGPLGAVCDVTAPDLDGPARLRLSPEGAAVSEAARASFTAAMARSSLLGGTPAPLDLGVTDDGTAWAVSPPVEGQTAEAAAAGGGLPLDEAVAILGTIARVADEAREAGIGPAVFLPGRIVLRDTDDTGGSRREVTLLDLAFDAWLLGQGAGYRALRERHHVALFLPTQLLLGSLDEDGDAEAGRALALFAFHLLAGRALLDATGPEEPADTAQRFRRVLAREPAALDGELALLRATRSIPDEVESWLRGALAGRGLSWAARELAHIARRRSVRARIERIEAEQASRPQAAADPDEQAVVASDWPSLVDEVRALAEPAAALVAVDLEPGGDEARAGGVRWRLPVGIARAAGRDLARAMLETAAFLDGVEVAARSSLGGALVRLFGRGAERRYRQRLDSLGVEGPLRREDAWMTSPGLAAPSWDGQARAALEPQGLRVEVCREQWITSHERGCLSEPVALVETAALPVDLDQFERLWERLASAAALHRHLPATPASSGPRLCLYCERDPGPLGMHDPHTCHACAEEYLGVIH